MGNPRKHKYTDIYINKTDIKQLRKGYTAVVVASGVRYSIHPDKTDKVSRKIEKLLSEVNRLKKYVTIPSNVTGKRPYRKKNTAFWNNGGNVRHMQKGDK